MINTLKAIAGIATRLWHQIPEEDEIGDAVKNAADSHLNKKAKLEVATDGIMVNDMEAIAKLQRERVRAYANEAAAKREGGIKPHGDGGESEGSGMIVADDVRVTNITRKGLGLAGALLSAGAIGGAVWLGNEWLKRQDTEPPAAIEQPAPKTGQIKLRRLSEFKDLLQ